jgi:hypothetical protein
MAGCGACGAPLGAETLVLECSALGCGATGFHAECAPEHCSASRPLSSPQCAARLGRTSRAGRVHTDVSRALAQATRRAHGRWAGDITPELHRD